MKGCFDWNNSIGHWEDDKKNGHGIYLYRDGKKYEGEWKNDVPEGSGVETMLNGERYEGEWKEGKKYGKGNFGED